MCFYVHVCVGASVLLHALYVTAMRYFCGALCASTWVIRLCLVNTKAAANTAHVKHRPREFCILRSTSLESVSTHRVIEICVNKASSGHVDDLPDKHTCLLCTYFPYHQRDGLKRLSHTYSVIKRISCDIFYVFRDSVWFQLT